MTPFHVKFHIWWGTSQLTDICQTRPLTRQSTSASRGVNSTKLYPGTSLTADDNLYSRICSKNEEVDLISHATSQHWAPVLTWDHFIWMQVVMVPLEHKPAPWDPSRPPPAHTHPGSCWSKASVTRCRKTTCWVSKEKQKQNWNQSQGFSTPKTNSRLYSFSLLCYRVGRRTATTLRNEQKCWKLKTKKCIWGKRQEVAPGLPFINTPMTKQKVIKWTSKLHFTLRCIQATNNEEKPSYSCKVFHSLS